MRVPPGARLVECHYVCTACRASSWGRPGMTFCPSCGGVQQSAGYIERPPGYVAPPKKRRTIKDHA